MQKIENDIPHLQRLVKGIKFAMLVTRDKSGALHSRPMTLQETDFDGDFWFFASRSHGPALDIGADPVVNLAFSNPSGNSFVSATGRAELSDDRAKMKELWNPLYKAWFKDGLEDPDLTLIRVHVESADFWDSPSSKVVQLLAFTKAVITGKDTKSTMGDRGHLDLKAV